MKNFLRLLIFFIITNTAFAGSPVIFKGTKAKVIASQGFEMFDGKFILSSSVDPGAVATPGDIGTILLSSNGKLYVKTDNGTSTNWNEMAPTSKFPALSTDDALTRFNGTTGDLQNSGVILSDADALTGISALTTGSLNVSGATLSTVPYVDASKNLVSSAVTPTELGYLDGVTSDLQTQLDAKIPEALTNANILVGNGTNIATGVAMSGDIGIINTGATSISSLVIVDGDVNASAAIAHSKMAALTASRATETDGSGVVIASAITNTELGYLDTVSSNIQTQLDAKTDKALTNGSVYVGSAGNLAVGVTMSGDIGIINTGATAIQSGVIVNDDINASAAIAHSKMAALTINRATETDASGVLIASAITNTELNYLDTVSSNIQTQLDAKIPEALTSAQILVGNGINIATGVAMSGDIGIDNAGLTSIASGVIVDGDINASAAIAHSKLAALSSANILVGSAGNVATSVAMSGDVAISNAGATSIANLAHSKMAALTINRALESDGSGVVSASAITNTELNYLDGVTSLIQTQLDAKIDDYTSTTDNALMRSDGTTGIAVQDSGVIVDDSDNITGVASLTADSFTGNGKGITSNEHNLLLNPGAEEGTGSWTNANGVLTQDTTTELVGSNAFKIALTAQSLDFKQDVTNLQYAGLQIACEANIKSSGAGIELCLLNGTTEIACAAYDGSDDWKELHVESPAPASGSMGCKFKSGSLTDDVYVDAVSLSTKSNVSEIAQARLFGTASHASATNCTWTTTSATFASYSADSDCAVASATGEASAPSTKIPAIKFASMPAGDYLIIAEGNFRDNVGGTQTAIMNWELHDGTSGAGRANAETATSTTGMEYRANSMSATFSYSSGQTDITFEIRARTNNASQAAILSNETDLLGPLNFKVYYYPPKSKIYSEVASSPFQGEITDTLCVSDLGLTADGSWNNLTNDSDCASFANTIGSGFSVVGGNNYGATGFLKAGKYEVCIDVQHKQENLTAGDNALQHFRGAVCSGSALCSTTTDTYFGAVTSNFENPAHFKYDDISVCGNIEAPSSGTYTINLQEKTASIGGTPDQNKLEASTDVPAMRFRIKAIEAYVIGSFKEYARMTGTVSPKRAISKLACDASSSITNQSGAWVSTIGNRASAACAVTLITGYFSATPTCTLTGNTSGDPMICDAIENSSTSIDIKCKSDSGGFADYTGKLICEEY